MARRYQRTSQPETKQHIESGNGPGELPYMSYKGSCYGKGLAFELFCAENGLWILPFQSEIGCAIAFGLKLGIFFQGNLKIL